MKAAVVIFLVWASAWRAGGQNLPNRLISTDSTLIPAPVGRFSDARKVMGRINMGVPADHYCRGLGFFCREELKMQKSNVPVIFRVGSVDDCNKLEQKPGYR